MPTEPVDSQVANIERARTFLESKAIPEVVDEMLASPPWLCVQVGFDFASFAVDLLNRISRSNASLYLVGSAAVGFSLAPHKAGRPFRFPDQPGHPSDLDIALVDEDLFDLAWGALTHYDRISGVPVSRISDRTGVYWGHIYQDRVPKKTVPRRVMLEIVSSLGRAHELGRYRRTIRIYRRFVDLRFYSIYGLSKLKKDLIT